MLRIFQAKIKTFSFDFFDSPLLFLLNFAISPQAILSKKGKKNKTNEKLCFFSVNFILNDKEEIVVDK